MGGEGALKEVDDGGEAVMKRISFNGVGSSPAKSNETKRRSTVLNAAELMNSPRLMR